MEVTIAMGHFCDIHGPCVILCTERTHLVPPKEAFPADTRICSACESMDLNTVYSCEDENCHYISTRTSSNVDTAHLLKDAVLRSLSIEVVEEAGRNSGTIYFGDNKRGHIISHVFNIKDSLARGFRRKYCIVIMGKHQVSLLNHYDFLEKNLCRISGELQQKANQIGLAEDDSCYRRDADKISAASKMSLRSLPLLVGEPHAFAHLHMWFVFLLRANIYRVLPHDVPECPVRCSSVSELRGLRAAMPDADFRTICYCILTGIRIEEETTDVVRHFRQLLPAGFAAPIGGQACRLSGPPATWAALLPGGLPPAPPRLLAAVTSAIDDAGMTDSALALHLAGQVMRWLGVASVLSWTPAATHQMMIKLEVQKCDMPLLSYWIPQSGKCVELSKIDWTQVSNTQAEQ